MASTYDQWADIYDSVYSYVRDDIPFYVDEAKRAGGTVLELGSGTGRVSFPIAEAGVDIVGVDFSPRMLDVARGKLSGLSDGSGSLSFIEADMQDFSLVEENGPGKFDLAIIPFRGFLSLLSVADQIRTLVNIKRHLAPGGWLAFNIFVPDINMLASEGDIAYHFRDVTDPVSGTRWVLWHQSKCDNYNQIINARTIVEELDDQGAVARKLYRDFQLRYAHIWEMHHLLGLCGYEMVDLFGDFERTPFDEDSSEMVWIAKPRE
ncbi:MAG: class I SAM-dependent methyltransferase [Chloroflexi bacterium]|nr:class I SAM-dependent methyltransferase [Chloroflexota bacterium]